VVPGKCLGEFDQNVSGPSRFPPEIHKARRASKEIPVPQPAGPNPERM